MRELTERQKRFADFYIQTGNAAKAARMAGYSARTAHKRGSENLKKDAIRSRIDARLEQVSSKRIADATEILEYLTRVMRGQDTMDKNTEGTQESKKKPDGKERLRAAELLGRRYRLFTEKKEEGSAEPVMIVDDYS